MFRFRLKLIGSWIHQPTAAQPRRAPTPVVRPAGLLTSREGTAVNLILGFHHFLILDGRYPFRSPGAYLR